MMYVPGGIHTISAGCAGIASAEVTIRVDAETAAVLNASLSKANADNAPQRALYVFPGLVRDLALTGL